VDRRWLLAAAALLLPPAAAGQDKKEPPPLRWAADPSGSEPYIFENRDGPLPGFEVELARYLAAELSRKEELVKGDWGKLPELLKKPVGDASRVDVVLNGYELRKDLEDEFPSTIPYYVYRLGVLVHKDSADEIAGWADLGRPKGKDQRRTVGVLEATVAFKYMETMFGDRVDLKSSSDVANAVALVEQKRLDATVQDNPAVVYYARTGKNLLALEDQRKPNYYVILTRKDDVELREQLNAALRKGIKDGTLKRIYKKYGVWNEDQERLTYWTEQPWPPFAAGKGGEADVGPSGPQWEKWFKELLAAAGMTVFLAVTSFPLAMLVGLLVALGRVYGPRWLAFLLGLSVEFLRGTPLLLQLYFVFYLVPQLVPQLAMAPLVAGIVGLAINYSAYESENYRAGLLAIPRGQMEAALSLGMTPFTAIREVVVPQAARIVIPPVTNDFIALFKDTSVCSVILITELTRKYNELYNFNRAYIVELAVITAGLYLVMSYPMALLARWLERRTGSHVGGQHR
jgi:polar amino acid transport system substrate-binding protein